MSNATLESLAHRARLKEHLNVTGSPAMEVQSDRRVCSSSGQHWSSRWSSHWGRRCPFGVSELPIATIGRVLIGQTYEESTLLRNDGESWEIAVWVVGGWIISQPPYAWYFKEGKRESHGRNTIPFRSFQGSMKGPIRFFCIVIPTLSCTTLSCICGMGYQGRSIAPSTRVWHWLHSIFRLWIRLW